MGKIKHKRADCSMYLVVVKFYQLDLYIQGNPEFSNKQRSLIFICGATRMVHM